MPLPTLLTTTVANACSSNGSVIVGSAPSGGGTVACWWDKATQTLTLLTQPSGITFSSAYDCSSDGSIIIGNDDNGVHAYWWDKTTGTPTELLPPSGGNQAQVFSCSSDGSVITGFYNHPVTGTHACWWDKTTGVPTPLNDLSAISIGANARAVSADGTIAVGVSVDDSNNMQPVWWLISTGVVTAMSWPGGNQPSETLVNGDGPRDCSSDGSIIVGSGNDSSFNTIACFWDKSTGTPTLLQQISGSTNGGRALSISDSGAHISGWADDSSFNQWAVWWDKATNQVIKLDFDPSADNAISDGGIGISADGNFVVGDNYINPGDVQTAVFWDISPPPPPDLLLQGRIFAAARAKGQRNLVTAIRARIRANSGLKGLLNWPDYSLSLQAKVTSGARALGALVPGNTVLAARIRANANLRQLLSGVTNIPVFPTLPVGFPVVVKPTFANISGSIPSGRSIRAPQQTLPIWEFELNFESLRDQTQNSQPFAPLAGFTDFTKLSQVFIANIGQYGKFLFDAWWDDSRLDQPIALGDGTSTRFLMVRTWGYGLIQFTEPVGSVNVITNVKINGTVQDPSTYFVTSNNVLVFRSAPANGVTITSTFSYYYLCQFSEDMQDYSEFMKNRWTAKIKFRSVEGATPFTTSGPIMFPNPVPPPPAPPSPSTIPNSNSVNAIVNNILVGDVGNFSASIPGIWKLPNSEAQVVGLLTNLTEFDFLALGADWDTAYALTSDGSLAFGGADNGATMWDTTTLSETIFQIVPGTFNNVVFGCSDDGSVAAGLAATSGFTSRPVIWTGIGSRPATILPQLHNTTGVAFACDSGGMVIVGCTGDNLIINTHVYPCFWSNSMSTPTLLAVLSTADLGPGLEGSTVGEVRGCSSDGTILAGWTSTGVGPISYGNYQGAPFSVAGSSVFMPCYWLKPNPNVVNLLQLPSGWIAGIVTSISASGIIAVGWGVANDTNGTIYPLKWNLSDRTVDILPNQTNWPGLPSTFNFVVGGVALCVSRDGTRVGGFVPAVRIISGTPTAVRIAKYWNL